MQLTINKSAQCSSQDVVAVHDRCCFLRLVNHGLYPQAGAISFSQRAHCPFQHFAIRRKKYFHEIEHDPPLFKNRRYLSGKESKLVHHSVYLCTSILIMLRRQMNLSMGNKDKVSQGESKSFNEDKNVCYCDRMPKDCLSV